MIKTYDSNKCLLGEGVFWHPLLGQLFWFDIENKNKDLVFDTYCGLLLSI